jgi:hypothetical protein
MIEETTDHAASPENRDTDALAVVNTACEAFLVDADPLYRSLEGALEQLLTSHRKSFAELQAAETGEQGELFYAAIDYAASVSRDAIQPLREILQELDIPATACAAWQGNRLASNQELMGLKDKERQGLSPLVPFLEGVARTLAAVEAGVVEWTRTTLAIANSFGQLSIEGTGDAMPQLGEAAGQNSDQPGSKYEQLIAAGQDLEGCLQIAADRLRSVPDEVRSEVDSNASKSIEQLTRALATTPSPVSTDDAPTPTSDPDWSNWYQQVIDRLRLSGAKWTMLHATVSMRADYLSGIDNDIVSELRNAEAAISRELQRNRETAERIFVDLDSTGRFRAAARELRAVLRDTTRILEEELVSRLERMQSAETDGSRAAGALDELRREIVALPEMLSVHSVGDVAEGVIDPAVVGREIEVRSAATAALEKVLAPTAPNWSDALGACLRSLTEESGNLQPVLRFYIGGAVEELMDVSGPRIDPELRDDAKAAAAELTLSGIDRVIEALSALLEKPEQSIDAVSVSICRDTNEFWDDVSSQVSAETTQEKLALQLESSADSAIKAVREGTVDTTRQVAARLLREGKTLFARGKELLRRSRAVITGEADASNFETTLNALSEVNKARSRLPPVYRRLFSFHPLTDESLMVGRDEDSTWLRTHFVARRRGRTNAVVLTGTPGCGVTTFMDAARRTYFRRTNFSIVDLPARITDEATLVGKLRETLELGEVPAGEASLAGVADDIMSTEYSGSTRVCVVDRLEHLFLRKIGGFDLAARMLRFMSETGPRIFWIATASDSAWQLLLKNEPLVRGLVSHYRLSGYDREDIEEIINLRHKRSALPIIFDPPAEITPLEQRRLRKAASEKDRQAIYREAYFDDFFAASGQNVMLAVFYWILSVRYVPEGPSVRVMPLPRLKFELLSRLSVPELFALKAFLEHATLTLGEYIEVSGLDDDAAFEVFESLGNSRIIELARDEDSGLMDLEFERIERAGRYRLRPLLVQPVIRSLRERNIVHW